MAVPAGESDGPLLLLRGLEAVQQPAPAVHVEHGRIAPHAEGADLCGGHSPLLPVPGADGVKVFQDVLQRKLQQLRQLLGHAEHVPALLEGTGEDLVSSEELVADLSQRPQGLAEADLRVDPIVDDLHGGGAVGPLVGRVEEVHFPTDHVDGFALPRLPQLPEHRFLHVAGDLRLAPGVVLPGQAQLQRDDGQVVMALVGVAVPPAAPDDHGHMRKPLRVLILEESFS